MNGDVRGHRGEVGSHRFAEFLFCIPPFSRSLKKNPLSLKTHYSSIGLLEERERERNGETDTEADSESKDS